MTFKAIPYKAICRAVHVNVKELISALLGVWLGTAPFGVKLMSDLALSDWKFTLKRVNLEWIFSLKELNHPLISLQKEWSLITLPKEQKLVYINRVDSVVATSCHFRHFGDLHGNYGVYMAVTWFPWRNVHGRFSCTTRNSHVHIL